MNNYSPSDILPILEVITAFCLENRRPMSVLDELAPACELSPVEIQVLIETLTEHDYVRTVSPNPTKGFIDMSIWPKPGAWAALSSKADKKREDKRTIVISSVTAFVTALIVLLLEWLLLN
ncbi:hypothetical protein LJB76_02475 [Clostridia bacterium OttesenSCG-928-O13]|nr:hypothetical protein [Clostridia bacterium OttesenSCG-928-O13]